MSRHYASPSQPWFRLGRFDIGTTEAVTLAGVASMVVTAIVPLLWALLALTPSAVFRGFVWQVLTWPLAMIPSLGAIWSLVVFWWAGREIERQTGRKDMGLMIGALTLMQSLLALGVAYLLGASGRPVLYDLGALGMLLVLIYIAENPSRPFFFNIPAWVIGAVIVGISVLSYIFGRAWVMLIVFLVGLLGAAIIARAFGMLTSYDALPWLKMPQRRPGSKPATNVRYGPWEGSTVPQHETDELDSLLDKIAANGLGSLTERERRRLDDLRKRRRGV